MDLGRSMEEKMSRAAPLYSERCIYRVPKTLRRINEKAYTPDVVSIGPFHYRSSGLEGMQQQKWRYLKCFFHDQQVISYINPKMSLRECLCFAKQYEEKARCCYAEPTDHLSSEDFTEMLVLDAVFIIEFLVLWHKTAWRSENGDPIFNRPWLEGHVVRDLTLLENQLPFFVIEGLFNLAFGPRPSIVPPLIDLIWEIFVDKNPLANYSESPLHILDVVRCFYSPSVRRGDALAKYDARKNIRLSATALDQAGVTFECHKNANGNLFDIQFEDGVLKIPHLALYDITESKFRNVIAWEQCHDRDNSYMGHYAFFMDSLINTPEDVELLVRKSIINNCLGDSGAAATFFNDLTTEIWTNMDQYYFSDICKNLNDHCNTRRNRWRATLIRDYFRNPWTVISVVAAVSLLILTLLQTIFSGLALRH